jgi:protein-S-isoprenylcysteine O-methyltransferase Ste14
MNLEKEINKIKNRNKKVEADKAWETSKARKIIIVIITYLTVVSFFIVANLPNPFVNSIVPTIGFLLSTLGLSIFKKIWIKNFYKN